MKPVKFPEKNGHKVCSACKEEKLVSEFNWESDHQRHASICRKCKNKKTNKYLKDNPWLRSYRSALKRCNDKKEPSYKYYGEKGIKFLLSKTDIEALWKRDNADSMKEPTLDRKESSSHYTYDNCRFIERVENCRNGGKEMQARQKEFKIQTIKRLKTERDRYREALEKIRYKLGKFDGGQLDVQELYEISKSALQQTCIADCDDPECQVCRPEQTGECLEVKEPYQKPPFNHLEVNYISVGYYKHEIDFGVLAAVGELPKTEFDKMLHMLNTAIKVANEMWERNKGTTQKEE